MKRDRHRHSEREMPHQMHQPPGFRGALLRVSSRHAFEDSWGRSWGEPPELRDIRLLFAGCQRAWDSGYSYFLLTIKGVDSCYQQSR